MEWNWPDGRKPFHGVTLFQTIGLKSMHSSGHCLQGWYENQLGFENNDIQWMKIIPKVECSVWWVTILAVTLMQSQLVCFSPSFSNILFGTRGGRRVEGGGTSLPRPEIFSKFMENYSWMLTIFFQFWGIFFWNFRIFSKNFEFFIQILNIFSEILEILPIFWQKSHLLTIPASSPVCYHPLSQPSPFHHPVPYTTLLQNVIKPWISGWWMSGWWKRRVVNMAVPFWLRLLKYRKERIQDLVDVRLIKMENCWFVLQ